MTTTDSAIAELQRLAKVILCLGGKASARRIARKLGVAVHAVRFRLVGRCGDHARLASEPALFARDGDVWGVTQAGRRLAKGEPVPGLAEAFADAPEYEEEKDPPRVVVCPGCSRERVYSVKGAARYELLRKRGLPLPMCRSCGQGRMKVDREITCPTCERTRFVSRSRAIKLAMTPEMSRECQPCARTAMGESMRGRSVKPATFSAAARRLAAMPTAAEPGTPEREAILAARAEYRLPLIIPGDAGYRLTTMAAMFAELAKA